MIVKILLLQHMVLEVHVLDSADVAVFCAENGAVFVADSVEDLVELGHALEV